MNTKYFQPFLVVVGLMISGSFLDHPGAYAQPSKGVPGKVPSLVVPDVSVDMRAIKVDQIAGDWDRETNQATKNKTFTRYQLWGTDLGVSFPAGDSIWMVFGDSWRKGGPSGGRDAIAYTSDRNPEDGLSLEFVTGEDGTWQPIDIPGIGQRSFEVPQDGVEVNGNIYLYHSTDSDRPRVTMGRSVLARAKDMKRAAFEFLYSFSVQHFINISLVKVNNADWHKRGNGMPEPKGEGLLFFGSGTYRRSNIFLAYQPAAKIEDSTAIRYFAGLNDKMNPLWSKSESDALPLFTSDKPCVGELSVAYNTFINRWVLLYNCSDPRRIIVQTAEFAWGPWSEPQVIFNPAEDNGFCHFIHQSWKEAKCDNVHDPGRENVRGSGYGPYQIEHFAQGDEHSTTIYFTLSTWNPYVAVLMKARLRKKDE